MHATDTLHNNLHNNLHNKNPAKTGVPESLTSSMHTNVHTNRLYWRKFDQLNASNLESLVITQWSLACGCERE